MTELVLLGGGHSHVEVLRQFGLHAPSGVRVTLISRGRYTPYSGMLPGLIAGHYSFEDAHIDLERLARFAGAHAAFDEVTGLDPDRRLVFCRDREPVPYDLLSINIGSTPNLSVPGAAEYAIPVKPIDQFLQHWDALRARIEARRAATRVAVVGGGAGGVELLLSVRHALCALPAVRERAVEFHLFTSAPTILPTHNARVRAMFARVFRERGIHAHTGQPIVEVQQGCLRDGSGARHAADEMLWTTEACAASWIRRSGLAADDQGFVHVGPALESLSHPGVFAAGDVASLVGHSLEKSGVYAVREGQTLAPNLRRALDGAPLRQYRPQRRFLSLISTGDRFAIASRGPVAVQGRWVWRWKDRIDRRFMAQYTDLPA